MFELIHQGCEQPAFRILRQPANGDRFTAHECVLLDGSTPHDGDPVVCGSCGANLGPADIRAEFVVKCA